MLATVALVPQQRRQKRLRRPAEGVAEGDSCEEEERADDLVGCPCSRAQGTCSRCHLGQDHGLQEHGKEHRPGKPQKGYDVTLALWPMEGLRPEAPPPERADKVAVANRGGKHRCHSHALQTVAWAEQCVAGNVHRQTQHRDEQRGRAVLCSQAEGSGHRRTALDGRAQRAKPEVADREGQHLRGGPQSSRQWSSLLPEDQRQEHRAASGDGQGVGPHEAAPVGVARRGGQEAERRRVQKREEVRGAVEGSSRRPHGRQLQGARAAHEGLVDRTHGRVGHDEAEGRRNEAKQCAPRRHPDLFGVRLLVTALALLGLGRLATSAAPCLLAPVGAYGLGGHWPGLPCSLAPAGAAARSSKGPASRTR
mmetsp:Transcript_25625/g.76431  ORF Transcript_25625/g.76431 Transcript_25625/m.76431 type:complete len:365 (-) Transcript_25625:1039-2133(-)